MLHLILRHSLGRCGRLPKEWINHHPKTANRLAETLVNRAFEATGKAGLTPSGASLWLRFVHDVTPVFYWPRALRLFRHNLALFMILMRLSCGDYLHTLMSEAALLVVSFERESDAPLWR